MAAAKLYGQFVGAPLQAGVLVSNDYKDSVDKVLWRDVASTSGNVIGDQLSLGVFASTAWLHPTRSVLVYDAFGAGCTLNVGDATFPTGLLSARSIAAAGSALLMPRSGGVAWRLWQQLGYPTDPGGDIELLATFAGANPANANLGWQIFGRRH